MIDMTRTFAALSDPTRLSLVEYLMRQGEQPAGALSELTDISAPAVSRHLKVLREAGVIGQRVAGTHRYYSVNPEAMRAIASWTMDHKAFWAGSLERLDGLLAIDPEGEE
ncbi:ArsR/SmtB family transcription factor [Mesobacterium pallidum]|uniref:ArsR/SmtB family transcription factor n=1 Tax=Mesobacterium pallidum TaxID=2872037 RepID=UPI001EE1FBBE|nr:metalloregulator ArsR/SmtB family transcription factor [Mesobacterium pallidum]